jgi:hypothetical protein
MSNSIVTIVVYAAVIVLLPVIPAYLLYSKLPNRTIVKGPFKGLSLHMTGSFGGFFVLSILTFTVIVTLLKLAPSNELWTVEGVVDLTGTNHHSVHYLVQPPIIRPLCDGGFERFAIENVPLMTNLGTTLLVDVDSFDPIGVPLNRVGSIPDKYVLRLDNGSRTISILDTLRVSHLLASQPAGVTVVQPVPVRDKEVRP